MLALLKVFALIACLEVNPETQKSYPGMAAAEGIPPSCSWTIPGMVHPGTLTTPSLWDKSQHLQGSAPCVAPHTTQP